MQTHQTFDPTDPALVAFMEDYLRSALQEQVHEQMEAFVRANEHRVQEFSLLERIVRVEEELRSLREMDAMRFDAMEKRFVAMDTRFNDLQTYMDKRFEQVDKRFEALTRRLDRFMIWSLGLTVSATFLIITILK